METDKFGFKVFVKDGPRTRHGILSIVIPYMILWEWQLLPFFHKNLFYRTCAEKAYDWRMKSQISTWPAGEHGSMIYWRYPKLPLKDVLSLSSLQITLHVRSIISVTPLRKLVDLCLVRFTFYFFIGKSCLAPFFKGKTIPRLELTADTVSVRLNKILTKKLELSMERFTFWTDSMTVIRYIAHESKRFHPYVANRIAVREESNPPHWKCIMAASPIPLMKLHQELQQTRSSSMAVG